MQEKKFKLQANEIRQLVLQSGGCLATDKITVSGELVGFMYRDDPDFENDSGWRFLSGTETQDYVDDFENWSIYNTNTIANYDRAIIPYLESPIGSVLERVGGTQYFRSVED